MQALNLIKRYHLNFTGLNASVGHNSVKLYRFQC